MFPGLGGMNPSQMKGMMKQLGIKSDELDVQKVTIELSNGKTITFSNPQVTVVEMKNSKSYTVTGDATESAGHDEVSTEDIELVKAQTDCTEEEARAALEESNGDIAEAIAQLKKEE